MYVRRNVLLCIAHRLFIRLGVRVTRRQIIQAILNLSVSNDHEDACGPQSQIQKARKARKKPEKRSQSQRKLNTPRARESQRKLDTPRAREILARKRQERKVLQDIVDAKKFLRHYRGRKAKKEYELAMKERAAMRLRMDAHRPKSIHQMAKEFMAGKKFLRRVRAKRNKRLANEKQAKLNAKKIKRFNQLVFQVVAAKKVAKLIPGKTELRKKGRIEMEMQGKGPIIYFMYRKELRTKEMDLPKAVQEQVTTLMQKQEVPPTRGDKNYDERMKKAVELRKSLVHQVTRNLKAAAAKVAEEDTRKIFPAFKLGAKFVKEKVHTKVEIKARVSKWAPVKTGAEEKLEIEKKMKEKVKRRHERQRAKDKNKVNQLRKKAEESGNWFFENDITPASPVLVSPNAGKPLSVQAPLPPPGARKGPPPPPPLPKKIQ